MHNSLEDMPKALKLTIVNSRGVRPLAVGIIPASSMQVICSQRGHACLAVQGKFKQPSQGCLLLLLMQLQLRQLALAQTPIQTVS